MTTSAPSRAAAPGLQSTPAWIRWIGAAAFLVAAIPFVLIAAAIEGAVLGEAEEG